MRLAMDLVDVVDRTRCGNARLVSLSLAGLEPLAGWLGELTAFAREHGGECYAGWSQEKLFGYLAWRALAGHLLVCAERGRIRGLALIWTEDADEVLRRQAAGEEWFDWGRLPVGLDLVLGDVIAAADGRAETLRRLAVLAEQRWPDGWERRALTWRHGRIVELSKGAVRRLLGGRGGTDGGRR